MAASVLSAKNVKQVARPNRTRLQGGEHAIGTPERCADSDGGRTRATRLVGPSLAHRAASGAAGPDHGQLRHAQDAVDPTLVRQAATLSCPFHADRRIVAESGRTLVCRADQQTASARD